MLPATQQGGFLPLSDLEHRPPPEKAHELEQDSSVLAIAVSRDYIYAGTQNGEILVWSLATFQLVHRVQAHKRSVLSLVLSESTQDELRTTTQTNGRPASSLDGKSLLLSSAGDGIVSIWDPEILDRLYEIYSTYDVGDVFCVAYSRHLRTVYMGAQNTTIQWIRLDDRSRVASAESAQHPDKRHHRFFDSKPVGGLITPRRNDGRKTAIPIAHTILEVDPAAIHQFAHFGYVYCMLMAKGCTVLLDSEEEVLISGGGDGTVKVWSLSRKPTKQGRDAVEEWETWQDRELMTLGEDDGQSVLSLAIDTSFLYAGKLGGLVELWDLDTKQKLRVIRAHRGDVMAMQMCSGCLYTAAATGSAAKHSTVHYDKHHPHAGSETVSGKYQCLARWTAHEGRVLAAACASHEGNRLFITGANDDTIKIWKVNDKNVGRSRAPSSQQDAMMACLGSFVAYKTVSSRPEFQEDCRRGASFLCTQFKKLGAQVEMLSTDESHNPVVYAKFAGSQTASGNRKRILFYGHYDVVPADREAGSKWATDPFRLVGRNGYLYGRGVTDNKGPIIAALYAVTDLMQAKQLSSDIIFVIEGEEESGSRGFQDTIRKHKKLIGAIDYILLANSYWINDETPCLTYGLRGVLHATVTVDSEQPDLHSGVDGSYLRAEPLTDLTWMLSRLKGPKNKIMIPGFYDAVLPLTAVEDARFEQIVTILNRNALPGTEPLQKSNLTARWREPNLTIHRYKVSGPEGSLVSSLASAVISFRLVPGQDVEDIIKQLIAFLHKEFEELETSNKLRIKIDNKAEPWLGDPNNRIFQVLEDAVMHAWANDPIKSGEDNHGTKRSNIAGATLDDAINDSHKQLSRCDTTYSQLRRPLYIREGGSIPAIRFLEKEFAAPAAHLPCGQASDSAHLDQERMRILNLLKSREIFAEVFRDL